MPDGKFPFSSCHLRKPVLCCGAFAYGDRLPVAAGKRLFAFAVSLLVCALFSGSRPMWGRGIGCVLRVPIVASWIRWDWLTTEFARRPWQRTR